MCYDGGKSGGDRTISRLINRPITVTLGRLEGEPNLCPVSFLYMREKFVIVKVLDTFLVNKEWWNDPAAVGKAPPEERFWRVQTSKGGVFELTQDGQVWKLYKAFD